MHAKTSFFCTLMFILSAATILQGMKKEPFNQITLQAIENICHSEKCIEFDLESENVDWLHIAAASNMIIETNILLNSGHFNINKMDSEGNTPLIFAILNSSPELVELLLVNDANPNVIYDNGTGERVTALHIAIYDKKPIIARTLLDYGADPNGNLDENYTPLMNLASLGIHSERDETVCVQIAQKLFEKGANHAAFYEKNKSTALIIAAATGKDSLVQMLLERGSSVHDTDKWGRSALAHALEKLLNSKTYCKAYSNVVSLLLLNGAKLPNQINKQTIFIKALAIGNIFLINALLQKGIDKSDILQAGILSENMAEHNPNHLSIAKLLACYLSANNEEGKEWKTIYPAQQPETPQLEKQPAKETKKRRRHRRRKKSVEYVN